MIVKIGDLMNEKSELRVHQSVIDQIDWGETGRGNSSKTRAHVAIKLHFGIERRWTEIAQRCVRVAKLGTVPIAAEVSGGDWISLQVKDEIAVSQTWKVGSR